MIQTKITTLGGSVRFTLGRSTVLPLGAAMLYP